MDLTKISMAEAYQIALTHSEKTIDAVSDEMGWGASQGYRFFNPRDQYWPPAHSIPRLCSVLGNTIVLDWLIKNTADLCSINCRPLDASGCVRRLSAILSETGSMAEVAAEIIKDNRVTPAEARELTKKLNRLASVLVDFIAASERAGEI